MDGLASGRKSMAPTHSSTAGKVWRERHETGGDGIGERIFCPAPTHKHTKKARAW